MARPQPTDPHLRIAYSIQEEIMMRDFSKRQRSILDLILRLSWGCQKKTATIPYQKDFELVGISKTKIKEELKWLEAAKVIKWCKESNEYSFIKNYDEWRVSIVSGYDKERFKKLLHLNLYSSQNSNIVPETVTANSSQNGNEVPEKLITEFPKRESGLSANIDDNSVCMQSKTSIKTNNNIYTDDFEKFYSTYPRPDAKKRTFNNFKRALKKHSLEDIMKACRNYKTKVERAKTEKEFIKTSANFLSPKEEYYEDYIDMEPIKEKSIYRDMSNYKVGE